MTVNADTNRITHEIHSHLIPQAAPASDEYVSGSRCIICTDNDCRRRWPLHAANTIFFGREWEVGKAVELIATQTPARVAILGPGGIGKTSIARAILHDSKVAELYGNRRCFLSCEGYTTTETVVRKLAVALGVIKESDLIGSAESIRDRLFCYLQSIAGIICLDNLETPWDADTAAMEDLLADISHLPSIALLITSGVIDVPLISWSQPPLAPISPFTLKAALQTWDAICNGHDEHVLQLVDAVDCVPLAVTLLARLARVETAQSLWARWEHERTDLLASRGTRHRLNNLGVSIEISLQALDSQDAIDVLSLVCISPYGIPSIDLASLEHISKNRLAIARAVTALKQLSLVYTDYYRTRVLSPIRHHVLQHHRISDELFMLYLDVIPEFYDTWLTDAYLECGLARDGPCRDRCLNTIAMKPNCVWDADLVSRATDLVNGLEPQVQAQFHRRLGTLRNHTGEIAKARSSFSRAIDCDVQLGDRQAQMWDWGLWIDSVHRDFWDCEEEFPDDLDEMQEAMQKIWDAGYDDDGVWDQGFRDYYIVATRQRYVNKGRRKAGMPVIRRSGLSSDSESEISLCIQDVEASYHQRVATPLTS